MSAARTSKSPERKFSKQKIFEALVNYKSNIEFLKLIEEDLKDVYVGLVAQSGVESTMPKAQGGISDIVHSEYMRRERVLNSKSKVVDQMKLIQRYCNSDEYQELKLKEQLALSKTLEGNSMTDVALQLKCHRSTVHRILCDISSRIEQFQ